MKNSNIILMLMLCMYTEHAYTQDFSGVNFSLVSAYEIVNSIKYDYDTISMNTEGLDNETPDGLVILLINVSQKNDLDKISFEMSSKELDMFTNKFSDGTMNSFIKEYWVKMLFKGDTIGIMVGSFFPNKLGFADMRDLVIMFRRDDKWLYRTKIDFSSFNLLLKNCNSEVLDTLLFNNKSNKPEINGIIEQVVEINKEGKTIIKPDVFRRLIRDLYKKGNNDVLFESLLLIKGEVLKFY